MKYDETTPRHILIARIHQLEDDCRKMVATLELLSKANTLETYQVQDIVGQTLQSTQFYKEL